MLDPSARAEILDLLKAIQDETETAYIFISHDLTSVAKISHRIAIMYLGHIVEHYNAKATSFRWTATADPIFSKVERLGSYISRTQH